MTYVTSLARAHAHACIHVRGLLVRRLSRDAGDARAYLGEGLDIRLQGIGLLGMFLSNCLGFSNLTAMLEARRRGILGDINPVVPPFLCGNCFAWCMYATAKQVRGSQPGLPPHR